MRNATNPEDPNSKMASSPSSPNPFLKIVLPEDGTIHVQEDGMLRFSIRLSNESDEKGIEYKLTTTLAVSTMTSASPNPGWIAPGEMKFVEIATKAVDEHNEASTKFGLTSEMVSPQYVMTYKYKNYFECAVDGNGEASFGVKISSPGRVLRSGRRSHIASNDVTIHPEAMADEASTARPDDGVEDQNRELSSLSVVHVIFLGLVWIAVFMTVYCGLSWAVFFHRSRFM